MTASVESSELPSHLGGQSAGNVDAGIVGALQNALSIRSLVDIGCGDGVATRIYAGMGLNVVGIDGDWTRLPDDRRFICHDFTQGPADIAQFDLAYSVEFLEHLEERYLANVMPLFAACRYAVVTAALPGQHGHHHVNCQPPDYWQALFAKWGLVYDCAMTQRLAKVSTMQKASGPRAGRRMRFFERTGMFFRHV